MPKVVAELCGTVRGKVGKNQVSVKANDTAEVIETLKRE